LAKRICAVLGAPLVVSAAFLFAQELQHVVTVVNIEVPVRVFKADKFVDNLSINDFEVYEDGKPQKIEAVYLIKKTSIKKEEGPSPKQFKPNIKSRHFVLMLEMDDYLPELGKVSDYFFTQVLTTQDTVWVVTPVNGIQLKKYILRQMPGDKIAEQIKSRLRKDIIQASLPLRGLIDDMKMYMIFIENADENAVMYKMAMAEVQERILNLKIIDESRLEAIADALKKMDGQKHIFLFYQREDLLWPSFKPMEARDKFLMNMDLLRTDYIDHKKIQKLFADASAVIHFLFLTKTRTSTGDVSIKDPDKYIVIQPGGDFYDAFRELAVTTGGVVESSANPAFAFEKAVEASENYYLLYYKPSDYKADGSYKEIKVRVKGGNYEVTHRSGYIAK
jgi:VWFA-related protein